MAVACADATWQDLSADDGAKWLEGRFHGRVEMWDLHRGRVAWTLRGQLRFAAGMTFSSDGLRLAIANPYPDGIVKIVETQTGRVLMSLEDSALIDQGFVANVGGGPYRFRRN